MADTPGSFYGRFWKRFRKDATPWARDNILWATVLVVPLIVGYFRHPHTHIDWGTIQDTLWLYGVTFPIYVLVHLCRIPKKLDDDREEERKQLAEAIAERDKTIRQITSTPQRTVAEQHHYDTAKRALQKLGPEAITALRHLKTHRTLKFGAYNPPLPTGMSGAYAIGFYDRCVSEGLVTRRDTLDRATSEATFEIAPTMDSVLDELLYEKP